MVVIVTWVIIDHTKKPPLNSRCSTNLTMTQAWFISLTEKHVLALLYEIPVT